MLGLRKVPLVNQLRRIPWSRRIPKQQLWRTRYRAYRHKYGRRKACWRGIVLSELYVLSRGKFFKGILADEVELFQYLVTVEAVHVEFHL